MSKALELIQKRAVIIEQMREAARQGEEARKKGESATDYDLKFDKAEAEERDLSKQIERMRSVEEAEKRAAADHIEDLEKRGEMPDGAGSKKMDYREAYRQWFINGNEGLTSEMRSLLSEKRGTSTQVVGTTTLGGYTIPTGFLPELERTMADYSGIFQVARKLRTDAGNVLYIPVEDDASTSAVLITETTSLTVQDLTFAQKQLDAYKYASHMKVSWELMQDSAFDIDAETRMAFGPRFGRSLNTACTTGTGSSQPNGVVTASTLGKTAASATAITFSEVADLLHSVDPAYRHSPSCGFMMNDAILLALKKIQLATTNTVLWMPSSREGEPDKILGFPFWLNQGMSSALTTGQKVMLFGDYSKYVIRIVKDLTMIRLNERYADNGLVGFIGYMRFDGECINTAAIKHLITA